MIMFSYYRNLCKLNQISRTNVNVDILYKKRTRSEYSAILGTIVVIHDVTYLHLILADCVNQISPP
jgi:hypothetical protein